MVLRYTRLKLRRRFRFRKRQLEDLSQTASKQLDRHIFRRWHNFKFATRFTLGWVGLMVILVVMLIIQTAILGNNYLAVKPVAGGIYTEGIVGQFTNSNPIYATSDVDTAVAKIVFDSLFSYDQQNNLVGNLASGYEIDAQELVYTVHLKPDITWHDGQVFTSDDVVFTYKTIQNADAKSPFLADWAGVKIEKVDDLTVKFTLPNSYGPFPHSLTRGILPKHLLQDVPAVEMRSVAFNTQSPVGTGPFSWEGIIVSSDETKTIQLANFKNYHGGQPKLDGVTIKTYLSADALLKALATKKVVAAAGLDVADGDYQDDYELAAFNLMSANMLFLKTTNPYLSSVAVRQALIRATNVPALLETIGFPVIPVTEPILNSQVGFNPAYRQLPYDKATAERQLEEAGWHYAAGDEYRSKDGKQLALTLAYENKRNFAGIAALLQEQWAKVGVHLEVEVTQTTADSQKYIDSHDYGVLLYGINIGADPDVYVYWHSSQITGSGQTRLNFSEYKSSVADLALESGRSRSDAQLRAAKYAPFLRVWQSDVPAIGLFQPRYLYISNQHIYGIENTNLINSSSDRFNNIENWMINTKRTTVE